MQKYLLNTCSSLLLLLLSLTACGGSDNSDEQFTERTLDELDSTLQTLFDEYNIPGVNAGLWVPGVGSWAHSVGKTRIEDSASSPPADMSFN